MTSDHSSLLFQPGRLGRLELRNRLVRSATAELRSDDEGVPSSSLADMYAALAQGGVGLIISGHAYVDRRGRCHRNMTAADRDDLIPHLARLAQAAHQGGAKLALQINFGGAQCDSAILPHRLAPSDQLVPAGQSCRALAPGEIWQIVEAFGQAARRAKEAGCDAVQIHGAHGYLISQFLSPLTNQRQDEWGGDLPGRTRFLREVACAVRASVGPHYPLFIKLGLCDESEGGLTLDEGLRVVADLAEMGFDAVEISHGIGDTRPVRPTPGASPAEREAPFLPWARRARTVSRLPIILVGFLRSRAAMEEVLASGAADFVSLCRPLICEPDLPQRFRAGLQDESSCISCERCWPDQEGEVVECRSL